MFKIAFPWALRAEERAERDYLKTLDSTSHDDVAGNVWVAPEFGTVFLFIMSQHQQTNILQHWTSPKITV